MLLEDILDEGAKRQYKKVNGTIQKRFRCTSGQRKGRMVAKAAQCYKRKDRVKARRMKKMMRSKKRVISRKSRIAKRRSISKIITRMNQRLSGKSIR